MSGDFGESWKPRPGDPALVGKVTAIRTARTTFGDKTILEVESERTGRRYSVWISPADLVEAYSRWQPKAGERVGIKRLADEGQRHRYEFRVERKPKEATA